MAEPDTVCEDAVKAVASKGFNCGKKLSVYRERIENLTEEGTTANKQI